MFDCLGKGASHRILRHALDQKITHNYLVCEQSVGRSLKKICNLAGVKYLSPHQIRFSDATLMAEQGESDKTISNRLENNMGSYYVRTVEAAKPIAGPAI